MSFFSFHDYSYYEAKPQKGYSQFGPFISGECNMASLNPRDIFEDKVFEKKEIHELKDLTDNIKNTATKLNDILKYFSNHKSSLDCVIDIRKWTFKQIKGLIDIYSHESEKSNDKDIQSLQNEIISIYQLCIPLLIGLEGSRVEHLSALNEQIKTSELMNWNVKKSSSEVLQRKERLMTSLEEIAQEQIYLHRDVKMTSNEWSYAGNLTCRSLFESVLMQDSETSLSTYVYPKNPLKESALWKILFQDKRTFTLFLRCTNCIGHFKEQLVPFLNTMAKIREDQEAFDDLIRYQYDFIKSAVIPKLNSLGLNPKTQYKIQTAWDTFHATFKADVPIPSWVSQDPTTDTLLRNLYSPAYRRVYPNSDPEKLANVSQEKVETTATILQELKEETVEKYKELLRDPQCTRYGLQAYLTKKISIEQFVSLCMAWSVVNVYDPEVKTTQIVKCNDSAIRPYYHDYIDLKKSAEKENNNSNSKESKLNDAIDKAINLTEKAEKGSEHFVLFLDFDTDYSHENKQDHSQLMELVKDFKYFLFPNKKHWIVPSITLVNSFLQTLFGSDHAKPVIGLGDFPVEGLANALTYGNRPFQISMLNAGNTIFADYRLTANQELLTDLQRPFNDPSLWLHDLFHIYLLGSIPLEHRLKFLRLAKHIQKNSPSNVKESEIYQKAYEAFIDMQFLDYETTSEDDKNNGYQLAFQNSINQVLRKYPAVKKTIDEFLVADKNSKT